MRISSNSLSIIRSPTSRLAHLGIVRTTLQRLLTAFQKLVPSPGKPGQPPGSTRPGSHPAASQNHLLHTSGRPILHTFLLMDTSVALATTKCVSKIECRYLLGLGET